jgi:hypothetical protein
MYGELAALVAAPPTDALLARAAELSREEKSLRSLVLHAVLLLRAGKLDDAETQLRAAQTLSADDPAVLINLAKLSHARGNPDQALALGRKALEQAPDDEGMLGFWASLMRLCGRDAELAAELPRLKGFRPMLWLAAFRAETGADADAEKAYAAALERASDPNLCLQTIARDLRAAGRHALLVRVVGPRFELGKHGPFVGLALAAAHAEQGELEQAERVLESVRPSAGREATPFITELEALLVRKRVEQPSAAEAQLTGVPLIGPVWAAPLLAAGLKLDAGSASRLVAIAPFADCTQDRYAVAAGPALGGATELEDACRALPLLLAEALTLTTTATGMALVATHGQEGLVALREPLSTAAALELCAPKAMPRVLVTGFFSRAITTELQLELSVLDLQVGGAPQVVRLAKGDPVTLGARAERELKAMLLRSGVLEEKPAPFTRPDKPDEHYLDVQHRVLALVLASQGHLDRRRLWGIVASLEAAGTLMAEAPRADTPALLLAATYLAGRPQTASFAKGVADVLAPFPWSKGLALT